VEEVPAHLIPLAILAAITSPTAIAAVLVILSRPRAFALLTGYVAGSFVMSVVAGIAIVAGLTATHAFSPRHSASLPVVDIVIGMLILLSAAWLRSDRSAGLRRRAAERRARRRAEKTARRGERESRASRVLSGGSVGLVTLVGAAMHLPGLLYFAALANIAHADVSSGHSLILLVLFNLVMLAPIELPLLGYLIAPEWTQDVVARIDAVIKDHWDEGLLLASLVAGGYLIVSGVVALAG
jgi:hypothetical protein